MQAVELAECSAEIGRSLGQGSYKSPAGRMFGQGCTKLIPFDGAARSARGSSASVVRRLVEASGNSPLGPGFGQVSANDRRRLEEGSAVAPGASLREQALRASPRAASRLGHSASILCARSWEAPLRGPSRRWPSHQESASRGAACVSRSATARKARARQSRISAAARRGMDACRQPPRRRGVQLELGSRQRGTANPAPLSSSVAEDRPRCGLARSATPYS